jgi:hypothetical protein
VENGIGGVCALSCAVCREASMHACAGKRCASCKSTSYNRTCISWGTTTECDLNPQVGPRWQQAAAQSWQSALPQRAPLTRSPDTSSCCERCNRLLAACRVHGAAVKRSVHAPAVFESLELLRVVRVVRPQNSNTACNNAQLGLMR